MNEPTKNTQQQSQIGTAHDVTVLQAGKKIIYTEIKNFEFGYLPNAEDKYADLARRLGVTPGELRRIAERENITEVQLVMLVNLTKSLNLPWREVEERLHGAAEKYKKLLAELAALRSEDTLVKNFCADADAALHRGDLAAALQALRKAGERAVEIAREAVDRARNSDAAAQAAADEVQEKHT
jgi:hypothetical protein